MKSLSDLEFGIAWDVMRGLRNDEIAAHLGVSLCSVRNHLRAAQEKTSTHDRLQLALWMARSCELWQNKGPSGEGPCMVGSEDVIG